MAKVNRFEINKLVRRVLTKNQVDMSTVSFSCMGGRILLTGLLKKGSGSEFTAKGVETMVTELRKVKGVTDVGSELGNWDINGGSIQKIDKAEAKKAHSEGEKKAAN